MPKVTIDGEEFEVSQGTTILQAALSRGKEIPHFCYHPGLSIAGNCRICLVEVEKAPKLLIACQTQVMDGMVVKTQTDKTEEAQNAVMEFLLINHPLDCPICDQAGECKLQDHAVGFGTGKSRYSEPKVAQAKAIDIGRHIMLDQERCIHCSRCTRFCDEISKTGELAFFQRGHKTIIGTYPGKRLDNPYSGNVADICPVGALTLKEFRFQTRVWYLKNTPTVCAGCSRGCNIVASTGTQTEQMTTRGQQDDRIKRLTPRVNVEVNGHWMCDEGRLSFRRHESDEELARAEGPVGTSIDWEVAMRRAAEALKDAAAAGRAGLVLSPRMTSESMHAWKELAESLGNVRIGVQQIFEGQDDDLLIRADKGSNSKGAEWIFGAAAPADAVLEAAGRGELDVLVVAGDPLDPSQTVSLADAVRSKVGTLIHVGPFRDKLAKQADLLVPMAAWGEEDGTVVNFEGRVQRVRRVHLPRGERRPGWRVAADLAVAAGIEPPAWSGSADVLESLAAAVKEYEGLTEERVGLLGVARATGAPTGA